ncbi:MAG: hypothetical protein R3C18_14005 [Planctomycetaceae bacterium]
MTKELELELTFLASPRLVTHSLLEGVDMVDVYIPSNTSVVHPRLRLRQQADRYTVTKKIPVSSDDASAHTEETICLTLDEFECLSAASGRRVAKTRYKCDLGGRIAEVDVFKESLAGLVLIDFEFANSSELLDFTPPPECLADVTQEEFIAGGVLAGKSYNDISPQLERFNYEPVR